MKETLKLYLKRYDVVYHLASKSYNKSFELYTLPLKYKSQVVTWWVAGRKFEAEIDPLRIIHIDPTRVDMMLSHDIFEYPMYVSEINGDYWNDFSKRIEDYDLYQALKRRLLDGAKWEETAFYSRALQQIEDGTQKWGCSTKSEFDERCNRLDELYQSIRNFGYKRQRELIGQYNKDPIENKRIYRYAPELAEAVVNVGPDGEIYFHDARHRFLIAKLLGLDSIPVRVKGRHIDWQLTREQYLSDESNSEYRSHPDITYL